MIILASTSAARRTMLTNAGIAFHAVASQVDEHAAKAALLGSGLTGRDVADRLAEMKAVKISRRHPGALVLGSDQTLTLENGALLEKPNGNLAEQLRELSGKRHTLHSAVVACEDGVPVWRHVDSAKLTMRNLSDTFIAEYVAREGVAASACVGGYRIEGPGVQLFARIEGSHFTILGLPLLPLLEWLRTRGLLIA